MGLITGIPAAPIRGVIWLAQVIQEQAEQELRDPAAVRRKLEEVERAREAGEISEQDEAHAQEEILGAVVHQPVPRSTKDEVNAPRAPGQER